MAHQADHQPATGTVRLQSADGSQEEVVELADHEWRWRAMPPRLPRAVQILCSKYDPVWCDRNNPYAHPAPGSPKWRGILYKFYEKHAPYQLERFDTIMDRYYMAEKVLYDKLISNYLGPTKSWCQMRKFQQIAAAIAAKQVIGGMSVPIDAQGTFVRSAVSLDTLLANVKRSRRGATRAATLPWRRSRTWHQGLQASRLERQEIPL